MRTNNTQGAKVRKLALGLARAANQAAFSLVEVTLAIGIVAIAIVPVFALIPTGLNTFHQAVDTSVGSQISQRIINDAQQTDFKALVSDSNGNIQAARFVLTNAATNLKVRYFDDQGNEVPQAATTAIYQAQTVITPMMSVPYTTGTSANVNLASVTVQIANSPGGKAPTTDSATKLWVNSKIPVATYNAIVANNQ